MEGADRKIEALIAAGKNFNYENFGILEPEKRWAYGVSPEWTAWTTRVEGAIKALFGERSAPLSVLKQARAVVLRGNGPEKFDEAKSTYMAALIAAREVLTEDIFGEIQKLGAVAPKNYSNKVFVVHGHDEKSKSELEIILKEMGLDAVALHRQADSGQTIIEKFEKHSDVGFAFIIMTPDEIAYLASQDSASESERVKEARSRPNVIFEFGYFVGKLGRGRTCCLYKAPVIIPSDLSGFLYKRFENSIEEVAYAIGKELKAAGYQLA